MKTFVASFNGHWIGGHGVIVANDLDQAKRLLDEKLKNLRISQPLFDANFGEIDLGKPGVTIQSDGDM